MAMNAAKRVRFTSDATLKPILRLRDQKHCVVCMETLSTIDLVRVPCGHEYCLVCLNELFQTATNDASRFPPRCCLRETPLEPNEDFLDSQLIEKFRTKVAEHTDSQRIYCHNPVCSVFIPSSRHRNSSATCDKCFETTCTFCKGAYHAGDCPFDENLQRVLRIGDRWGWQRCPNCRTMIEHTGGCKAIMCTECGFQFCYDCLRSSHLCRCFQRHFDDQVALEQHQRNIKLEQPKKRKDKSNWISRLARRLFN